MQKCLKNEHAATLAREERLARSKNAVLLWPSLQVLTLRFWKRFIDPTADFAEETSSIGQCRGMELCVATNYIIFHQCSRRSCWKVKHT